MFSEVVEIALGLCTTLAISATSINTSDFNP